MTLLLYLIVGFVVGIFLKELFHDKNNFEQPTGEDVENLELVAEIAHREMGKKCHCGIHIHILNKTEYHVFDGPALECNNAKFQCEEYCNNFLKKIYGKGNRCHIFTNFTKIDVNTYWQLCEKKWNKIKNMSGVLCCKDKEKVLCDSMLYRRFFEKSISVASLFIKIWAFVCIYCYCICTMYELLIVQPMRD